MDLATVSSFFSQFVPLFFVGLIAHQVYMANEVKSIRKDLNNHIPDNSKKIDNFRKEMKEGFKEIKEMIKK